MWGGGVGVEKLKVKKVKKRKKREKKEENLEFGKKKMN